MQPATTSAQALSNLQTYQGTEQSPDAILNSQEQSLGVPGAQAQVSGLRQAITNTTNLLNQVAPSVYGRTQNSLVTDAQANAQIGNEQAPIQTKLSGLNTSEGNAASDYSNLLSQAGTLAGLQSQGQTDQENYLQQIYQNLYGQESDAAKLAEQAREANLTASSANSNPGIDLGSLLGTGSTGGTPAAIMSFKNPNNPSAGYAFSTPNGQAISAGSYAKLTGQSVGTVLQAMGKAGDTYAQAAYNQIKANQPIYSAQPNLLKTEFPALFWGT